MRVCHGKRLFDAGRLEEMHIFVKCRPVIFVLHRMRLHWFSWSSVVKVDCVPELTRCYRLSLFFVSSPAGRVTRRRALYSAQRTASSRSRKVREDVGVLVGSAARRRAYGGVAILSEGFIPFPGCSPGGMRSPMP